MNNRFWGVGVGLCVLLMVQMALADWTIVSTHGDHGSIDPVGEVTVTGNGPQAFSMAASNDYHIAEVFTNGVAVGFDDTSSTVFDITISNITDHGEIHVEFARNEVVEYVLGPTDGKTQQPGTIIPASLYMDIAPVWSKAMTGSMPVNNRTQWVQAVEIWQATSNSVGPPLTGSMPVASPTNAILVAYPPLLRPTAPLGLSVAVTDDGDIDVYWRDSATADADEFVLQVKEVGVDGWDSHVLGANHPWTNSVLVAAGKQYRFRVATQGNGYLSEWSAIADLRTYVTDHDIDNPQLDSSTNAVTLMPTFNMGIDRRSTLINVVVHGSQSGRHCAMVTLRDGDPDFSAATRNLFPGEDAWIVATPGVTDDNGDPILPRSWYVRGDVRFGGGSFTNAMTIEGLGFMSAAPGDMDGNGRPDLVTLTDDGAYLIVFWDDDLTGFASAWNTNLVGEAVGAADLTGDGRCDLVFDAGGGGLLLFASTAARDFASPSTLWAGDASDFAFADLDSDGDLDVVVLHPGGVTILRSNGLPEPGFTPQIVDSAPTAGTDAAIFDANGDGFPDIVVATDETAQGAVLINEGNGHFMPRACGPASGYSHAVIADDISGDAMPDLLFVHDGQASEVWTNCGAGCFALYRDDVGDGSIADVVAVETGDVDGDKLLDTLIGKSSNAGSPIVMTNRIGQADQRNLITEVTAASLGDWNADGSLDLFLSAGNPGKGYFFMNEPPPRSVQPRITYIDSNNWTAEWDAAQGAEAAAYEWERTDDDGVFRGNHAGVTNGLQASGSGVSSAFVYTFRVRPRNAAGEVGDWGDVSFKPGGLVSVEVVEGHGSYQALPGMGGTTSVTAIADSGHDLVSVSSAPPHAIAFDMDTLPATSATIPITNRNTDVTLYLSFGPYDYAARVPNSFFDGLPPPTNGASSIEYGDADGDGMLNWEEAYAGTSPTSATSVLVIEGFDPVTGRISWRAATNRQYWVEYSTNLVSHGFEEFLDIIRPNGTDAFYELPTGWEGRFFRVRVHPELDD